MKALSTTAAAAALVGATALGGAAVAQDAPELTEDQQFAVSVVQEFNTCVAEGLNDPAYIAAQEEVQSYNAQAEELITTDPELSSQIKAMEEQFMKALSAQTPEEQQAAVAELETMGSELEAAVVAELGPIPEEPADPSEACMTEAEQTISENGSSIQAVQNALYDIAVTHGPETVDELIAPTPAPAPAPAPK